MEGQRGAGQLKGSKKHLIMKAGDLILIFSKEEPTVTSTLHSSLTVRYQRGAVLFFVFFFKKKISRLFWGFGYFCLLLFFVFFGILF